MTKSGLFNTEPYVDTVVDKDGNKLLADTPRMWRDFIEITRRQIARELEQAQPPGVDSWNLHWMYRIRAMKKGQENAEKYINYIIDSRRESGLPELIFEEDLKL